MNKLFSAIPSLGIAVFLALYIYATLLYPGGSVTNPDYVGFDWINNFWCDLLSDKALNGSPNAAKPYGITAMIWLCAIVAIFFFQFADAFESSKRWRYAIKIFGGLSMFLGALIFTPLHNSMIGLASILALIPIIGVFKRMIQSRIITFLLMGIVCAILLGLCNYFYYSRHFIAWLPLVQKIALLAVLIWVVMVNLFIVSRTNVNTDESLQTV